MTDMPTPLTDTLRAALEDACAALVTLDGLASDRRSGVNDRDHYRLVQDCLDELVTALLAASAASPRQRLAYTGARFDLGEKSQITPLLTEASQYLMRTIGRRTEKDLSQYNDANTAEARGHLAGLVGVTVASVDRYAVADLATIRKDGINRFLTMADHIAVAAKGEPVDPDATA